MPQHRLCQLPRVFALRSLRRVAAAPQKALASLAAGFLGFSHADEKNSEDSDGNEGFCGDKAAGDSGEVAAADLSRLAGLYRAQAATLKQDLRFYRAEDAKDALDFASRMTRELRSQGPQAAREVAWRSFALLVELYAEIARAARPLLREAGETAFPSLITASRAAPKPRGKTPPTPPTPPAPPSK